MDSPDYSQYTVEELRHALGSIDQINYPERVKEISVLLDEKLNTDDVVIENPEKSTNESFSIQKFNIDILNIWFRRFLAAVQIGGGFLGIITIFQSITQIELMIFNIIIVLLAFGFYSFSIYTGFLLNEGSDKAIFLTKILYMIQIPYFTTPIISCYFYSGFYIIISTGIINVNFNYQLGSSWALTLFDKATQFAIGMNFVAVIIFAILYKLTENLSITHNKGINTETSRGA